MAEQWRILVVEDDPDLHRTIVNSLRKDGYLVQGVSSGAEAIRLLWTSKYDMVICNQKMQDADGFELLQWMRVNCPSTRMIMIAAFDSPITRTQALEGGAVSYLERPLDLHLLKEELRRLLQQTGFSASLDSFDLLDVIQIITMSRKTIALVVNAGLEEQGLLGFQGGELIWAEYGVLLGEEAFFALAAHKNGTVLHQPWNGQITPNVTQPLSRLILQALQYREKYATFQQLSGEQEAIKPSSSVQEVDDSPFALIAEPALPSVPVASEEKEWWQQSGQHASLHKSRIVRAVADTRSKGLRSLMDGEKDGNEASNTSIRPSTVHKTLASQRADLPSWLIDQPTQFDLPAMRLSPSNSPDQLSAMPVPQPPPAEWQPPPVAKTMESSAQEQQATGPMTPNAVDPDQRVHQPATAEWQPPEDSGVSYARVSQPLKSISRKTDDVQAKTPGQESGPLAARATAGSTGRTAEREGRTSASEPDQSNTGSQRATRRDYAALVAALQTLGYSVAGFIASAVVTLDGQPVAQVAVDDLDISRMCRNFSEMVQGALLSLEGGKWGRFEQTVITSASHHILLRIVGSQGEAFQVLITTREADPAESLEVMANVEGAIASALR